MKAILIVLLLLISIRAFAPGTKAIYIAVKDALTEFDALIKAVTWVESKNGLYVYNPVENAVGQFQIRQCRVSDYNKQRGTNYQLIDFYDYDLSREMFLYYSAGLSFERASREWNGGPKGMKKKSTIKYWDLVKSKLR